MTILHSKNNQQGDTDDPPPKKKSKKSKSLIRGPVQTHVSLPTTSSGGAGPSHRLPEQIGIYSYLTSPQSYYSASEQDSFLSSPQHYFGSQADQDLDEYFGPSDREILKFKLDKFDVGVYQDSNPEPFTYEHYPPPFTSGTDLAVPGTSKAKINVRNKIYDPNSLEYYIYGRGSLSPNSKKSPPPRGAPCPDWDLIEVISSEEIVALDYNNETGASLADECKFDGVSLLDDINNFDIDDKFGEIERFQQDAIWENSKMYHVEKSLEAGVMINGYDKVTSESTQFDNRLLRSSPTASLSNLGNTCFLNSVLYTLRFAPNFLHNLHHLVTDMNLNTATSQVKKTSSLGRNMSLNWTSNKELTNGDSLQPVKTKKQIVTEKLHEVYEAMNSAERKEHIEPFHPDVFLTALREVNPIFEGNQQQDAHELLVCLLDIFREASASQAESKAAQELASHGNTVSEVDTTTLKLNNNSVTSIRSGVAAVRNSIKVRTESLKSRKNEVLLNNSSKKKNKRDIEVISEPVSNQETTIPVDTPPPPVIPGTRPSVGTHNFVAHDFEGVMVLKTTCLECENTTEKKEPFADICVPIKTDYNDEEDESSDPLNPSELYQRAVVTDEFLRDRNKYYCEECLRYNEARRSVRYQTLPRLLTLQLKRFSSTYGAMSKVTQYMPTPMTLTCFCEECRGMERVKSQRHSRHGYELYGVIMHLGPNMAGGHYIAYLRTSSDRSLYRDCLRDITKKAQSLSVDSTKPYNKNNKIYNFFKNKGSSSNNLNDKINETKNFNNFISYQCGSFECCAVKHKLPECEMIREDSDETIWFACDDDNVKMLSGVELEGLLAKNSTSNATPYLLFYSRRTH